MKWQESKEQIRKVFLLYSIWSMVNLNKPDSILKQEFQKLFEMFSLQVTLVSVMGKPACQLMYSYRDSILSQHQCIKRTVTLNGENKTKQSKQKKPHKTNPQNQNQRRSKIFQSPWRNYQGGIEKWHDRNLSSVIPNTQFFIILTHHSPLMSC